MGPNIIREQAEMGLSIGGGQRVRTLRLAQQEAEVALNVGGGERARTLSPLRLA
jgi:hypothetical protein